MNPPIKILITNTLMALWSICFYAQTNVYHKFPTNNAMWRESSGGYQSSNCKDYQYTISGDTISGSYTYHKIQNFGVRTCS